MFKEFQIKMKKNKIEHHHFATLNKMTALGNDYQWPIKLLGIELAGNIVKRS